MADLLNGTSGHMQFAPLSSLQTQSMCKHLRDRIVQVESRADVLEHEKRSLADKAAGVWAALQKEVARIDRLREELEGAQGDLAGQKRALSSADSGIHKLQTGLEQSNQNVSMLRDAQRRMDERLSDTAKSLERNDRRTAQLLEALEKQVNPEAAKLRADLGATNFNVARLLEAVEALKASSQAQLEQIRAAHGKVQATEDGLARTHSLAEALQQQSAEHGKALKDMQKAMDGARSGLAKLRELQERAAAQVAEVGASTKKNSGDISKNTDALEQTGNAVQKIKQQMNKALSDIGATKQNVTDMHLDLQRLRSSHQVASEEHGMLARQVQQIEQSAWETRKGLCQTNAVVLPNLQMNSGVALSTDVPLPVSGRTPRGGQPVAYSAAKVAAAPGAHSARNMDNLKWT
mmetsp:Transcript_101873/g.288466  ORF Transcript_101873/g.288466 Transcript_101873/m.288466 type:complete len:406 (-) Transcript_101873:89-1306(-)